VPDVWLDETAEGNVFAALRTREADLDKHLTNGPEAQADAAREKAREEARQKLEEQLAKDKNSVKPLPEFGSTDDFQLVQALNQLQGKPVMVSKNMSERKAEASTAR
jgi:carboxyl-terminal processing protease